MSFGTRPQPRLSNRINAWNRFSSWRLTTSASALLSLAVLAGCGASPEEPYARLHDLLASTYRPQNAYDIVEFLSDRWRLRGGGNRGFDEPVDFVRRFLEEDGFTQSGRIEVLEGPLTLQPLAWEPFEAELSMVQPMTKRLHTYEDTPTLLCKYSGSTPEEGVTAELVDVGDGGEVLDYDGLHVRGKIVLGRADVATLFHEAVEKRGALGVISDRLRVEGYDDRYPDMVRSGTLPFREPQAMVEQRAWGLKVSPRTSAELRRLLSRGPVRLRVKVRTKFFESRQRVLVAEIPGTRVPGERVVLVAHIDNAKPGANNNASGVGGQAELARAIARLIGDGRLKPPSRTLTFLFGAEREGSRLWIDRLEEGPESIVAVLNSDMTGEDTRQTGGSFLLERTPDPAMHSPRPERFTPANDRHTGWGYRPLDLEPYPGHFLNDFVWSAIEFRAGQREWKIAQNPYEGGSDHDVFLPLLVPTTLSWHWVDAFIGTNLDTPDKVSPAEMQNVALAHGIAALRLASAGEEDGRRVLRLVEVKAIERLNGELAASKRLLAALADSSRNQTANDTFFEQIRQKELSLLESWARWYDEALQSVSKMPVGGPTEEFSAEIEWARGRVRNKARHNHRLLLEFRQGGSNHARGTH